jgi:hypothetical protein
MGELDAPSGSVHATHGVCPELTFVSLCQAAGSFPLPRELVSIVYAPNDFLSQIQLSAFTRVTANLPNLEFNLLPFIR